VDSSAAAALLKEEGYQVTGVTMKIWEGESSTTPSLHHGCYGPEEAHDIEDARQVAEALKIPFHVLDLTQEYKAEVLDYFCEQYLSGRTPSPCVRCNQRVKFSALIQKAAESGIEFDFIASGHYARTGRDAAGRYLLKKAKDLDKDQTYFLAFLSQAQLKSLIFPLGTFNKTDVRKIAERYGLKVAEKADSQNFISGDYANVIKANFKPGPILDQEGRELGQHQGIHLYTIGQRKGLGIASQNSLYVTKIDAARNTIIVGEKSQIYKRKFEVTDLNWIGREGVKAPLRLKTRIRSTQEEADSLLTPLENGILLVEFDEPQPAITPGQAAVFYEGESVAGGGIISRVID
jgi:tRNA-uridine 2-sulfurtransferase